MKLTLFTIMSVLFILCAKAQKRDIIYRGCITSAPQDIQIDGGDETIFDSCPQFGIGSDALNKYLSTHIHYPSTAKKNTLEGKVFIATIIEKDGSISHAKVVRSVSPDLDREAMRVVTSMPKWRPGILKGKPVRVYYYLPVNFTLNKI